MANESNSGIRRCAVRELRRRLRKPKTTTGQPQDNLLATPDLIQWLSKRSVCEVQALCVLIGGCNRGTPHEGREQAVEDLLRGLLPGVYTDASYGGARPLDGRPLERHYAKMLPACSSAFVKEVLDAHDQSNPLYRWRDMPKLVRCHPDLFRQRADEHLLGFTPYDAEFSNYVNEFLTRDKHFAIETLRARVERKISEERWKGQDDLNLLLPIVQGHLEKRRATEERELQVLDLVQLGLELVKVHSHPPENISRGAQLFKIILGRWKRRPDFYEDALVQAIGLGLSGSPKRVPENYLAAATSICSERKPHVLRLFFLHSPKCGVDIFEDDDLSALAGQFWPRALFDHVSKKQTIRILKGLYRANLEYSFLERPNAITILMVRSTLLLHLNFNADLFLTMLQRHDVSVQEAAKETVASLRKKAESAREPMDRATFAQAAAACSIATGNLDVYGSTIAWQQRFVRDPLTLREIMGISSILTKEGIELMSAIPGCNEEDDGCEDIAHPDLDMIRSNISKADAVFKTLQSTYNAAKRERTFQELDWRAVTKLVKAAYTMRVSRIASFHEATGVPLQEIQSVVWDGIMSAINWMDGTFLGQILESIRILLKSLDAESTVKAIESLEAFSNTQRVRPDQSLLTVEYAKLEHLTSDALSDLAHSNQPALAWPLVIRMVLDRPSETVAHRKLLSVGFLRRLQRAETHALLMGLAKSIGDKLKEPHEKGLEPKVKVSTVKLLAQLLNNADFISKESSIDILVELFKIAHHRDIRIAALESLLSVLDGICNEVKDAWVDNVTIAKVLDALETAVPVAGSIDERRPLSPEDWAAAETTGVLPEIADISAGQANCYVLMKALAMAADNRGYSGLKHIQAELVKRITLPIIQRSQSEHARWIRLFLAKYKAPFPASVVPSTPMAIRFWEEVLSAFYPLVSTALLEGFTQYGTYRIRAQSPALQQFNATLRADVELRKKLEVKHWLHIYDRSFDEFRDTETASLTRLLQDRCARQVPGDYGAVVDAVFHHATLFLDEYEKYASVWDSFISVLRPTGWYLADARSLAHWRATYGSILAKVCDEVAMRKKQNSGALLPWMTKPRLWLLSLPLFNSENQEEGKLLASQIGELLQAIFNEDEDAILHLADINDDMDNITGILHNKAMQATVAAELGRLAAIDLDATVVARPQAREAVRLVELRMAIALFEELKRDDLQVQQSVQECVDLWTGCNAGTVREGVFKWKGRHAFLEFLK